MKKISSRRAKACFIPPKVKADVWKRDKECSIISESIYAFPNAHYIPRSQGGLGIKENIVTLTPEEHYKFDFGTRQEREEIRQKIKEYLDRLYPDFTDEMRKYRKE